MENDIKASAPLTATGVLTFASNGTTPLGRVRIRAIRFVNGATAGSVVLRNGVGGPIVSTLGSSAAVNEGTSHVYLPGRGILCENGVHATITNVAEVVVFYEGQ